jgi:sporulation protein YlmC with PRC-barrel domain
MHSVNGLFGKEVVVRDTGEKQATVKDIVFGKDAKAIVALLIGGSLFDGSRVVRWKSIVSLKDVVVVHGDAPFERLKDEPEVENPTATRTGSPAPKSSTTGRRSGPSPTSS